MRLAYKVHQLTLRIICTPSLEKFHASCLQGTYTISDWELYVHYHLWRNSMRLVYKERRNLLALNVHACIFVLFSFIIINLSNRQCYISLHTMGGDLIPPPCFSKVLLTLRVYVDSALTHPLNSNLLEYLWLWALSYSQGGQSPKNATSQTCANTQRRWLGKTSELWLSRWTR
jgi:hypothetical protein